MQTAKWMPVLVGAALLMATYAWAAPAGEDTASGEAAMAMGGQYKEAPMLAAMVAAGELPPVDERLPIEPKVLEALEEIGTYGGTIEVFANANHPWNDLADSPERSQYPLRMNFDGSIEADQAKAYELSDDFMTFTLYLREGMKWSNGDDLTSEDFVFVKYQMDDHESIDTWGYPGQVDTVTAIDDYTVQIDFKVPYPRIVLNMLHWRGSDWTVVAPSTWLKQWHIEYNPNADAKAKEEGFDNWAEAFNNHHTFCCPAKDVNKPTLHPWKWQEHTTTVRIWERNPFYYAVDTAGQQLPYIDRIVSQTVNAETYKLKVIAGEADYAGAMTIGDFPLLKQNEEAGNYTVKLVPHVNGGDVTYTFVLDNLDPVKRELFNNVDFRRAMSLAIDREEINETVWLGQAVPRQATLNSDVSFYKSEWGEDHPYNRYAPDEANAMLDALGLDQRNRDGLRLMSNGEPMSFTLTYDAGAEGASEQEILTHELVKEDWAAVGVEIKLNPLDSDLIRQVETEGTMDVRATRTSGMEMYDFLSGNGGMLGVGHRGAGRFYSWWGAERGNVPEADRIGEPPPEDLAMLYQLGRADMQSTLFGSQEYRDVRTKIFDLHADKLWTIGVVGMAPYPLVVRNNLGNVPRVLPPWAEAWLTMNYYSNMWFFKN